MFGRTPLTRSRVILLTDKMKDRSHNSAILGGVKTPNITVKILSSLKQRSKTSCNSNGKYQKGDITSQHIDLTTICCQNNIIFLIFLLFQLCDVILKRRFKLLSCLHLLTMITVAM